jgi:hypothetical protein
MKAPKDGHTLEENLGTQPLGRHRAFNNHEALTEGWYPALPARSLPAKTARSVFGQLHRTGGPATS